MFEIDASVPQIDQTIAGFELNRVYAQDCINGMSLLPDKSFDLAIADPPYNASKGNNWSWKGTADLPGFGGQWSKVMEQWDDLPLQGYFVFCVNWLSQLKRLIKPTGSIWIHGTYHNIGIINFILQLLRIEIINEVIWFKRNSFPNLSCRRLTASHETILWCHTGGKKRRYYFDYQAAKKVNGDGDLLKKAGKQMRTVWDIPNNKEPEELVNGRHPTQKPLRLLHRMIAISAKPGQLCLVPFSGTGSECLAARNYGLKFLGFETNEEYFKICEKRLQATINLFS